MGLPTRSGRTVSEGGHPNWENRHATVTLWEEWPTSHSKSSSWSVYINCFQAESRKDKKLLTFPFLSWKVMALSCSPVMRNSMLLPEPAEPPTFLMWTQSQQQSPKKILPKTCQPSNSRQRLVSNQPQIGFWESSMSHYIIECQHPVAEANSAISRGLANLPFSRWWWHYQRLKSWTTCFLSCHWRCGY